MKKTNLLATLILVVCWFGASADTLVAYDLADYGTTASITNAATVPITLTYARITYDAATTNTLAVYVTKNDIDYRIGTSTVTNAQYVDLDLTDITLNQGDVLKMTTTDTNVTVLVTRE